MGMIETTTLREPWDVDRRLSEMGLTRANLLEVRDVAVSSAANATDFHPANAAGTFSYQEGTWALRDRHIKVGGEWEIDRSHGVEAIKNDERKLKLVFANVDMACNDQQEPKPRSKKGSGGERAFSRNFFGEDLTRYVPEQSDGYAAYDLMVDDSGGAELTRPVVKGGTFSAYVERIYLSDGTDLTVDKLSFDDSGSADNFDPVVIRK